jgi:hypothetical protein
MLEEEDLVVGARGCQGIPDAQEGFLPGIRLERHVEHARLGVWLIELRIRELRHEALIRRVGQRPGAIEEERHSLPAHALILHERAPLASNVMAKRWVLDTETKGTGARMVPLDDVLEKPEPKAPSAKPAQKKAATPPPRQSSPKTTLPKKKKQVEKRSTPLPPGHVRKKSTGELGKVKGIDAKAGTATVTWLRDGRTSTVPISSVTRK